MLAVTFGLFDVRIVSKRRGGFDFQHWFLEIGDLFIIDFFYFGELLKPRAIESLLEPLDFRFWVVC